jgi:hypothetical protein
MGNNKGSGWRNESRRHSLARRGIKTANGSFSLGITIDNWQDHIKDQDTVFSQGDKIKNIDKNKHSLFTGDYYDEIEMWELDGYVYYIGRNYMDGESVLLDVDPPLKLVRKASGLTVPEKHQLKVAIKTIKMPNAMVDIIGGMSKKEAREIIYKNGTKRDIDLMKEYDNIKEVW